MTNTYNTLNPLGSTSAKDLSDNASNFDEGMNSLSPSFYDRFKRRRETWAGMEKLVHDFLEAMGFEATHLVYVDGTPLTVLRPTQLIDRAGSVYKVKAPAVFPVMLTGTWATDQNLLVDVGDAALRADLANTAIGVSLVAGAGRVVNTVADLLTTTADTQSVFVLGYYVPGDGGGGQYIPYPGDSTSVVDSGTVLSANGGTGRWKLRFTDLNLAQMGIVSASDIAPQLNAAGAALYAKGGGSVHVSGTYNLASQVNLYPEVKIVGGASGRLTRISVTHSGVAFETIRPDGYAPLCIGAEVSGLSIIGLGIGTGVCFAIRDAMQCTIEKNEIALFGKGFEWNRGSTVSTTYRSFFNKISQNIVKPCGIGHFFGGAANRNTIDTNSYADCTVAYDFTQSYNYSETNTFLTENVEGCHSWAEWPASIGDIYSQTWVNLCVENPSTNGFACQVRDPGRQVFVNLSIIPLGDPASIVKYSLFSAPSMVLGSAASSGTNRLGMSVPETLDMHNVIVHHSHYASANYTGTISAGGVATINIALASALTNDRVECCALRTISGCIPTAYASDGLVTVNISNPTTSPVTITAVEFSVILKRVSSSTS